jgi:predicted anti-sigma-YlaC factor YlaD
MGKLKSTMAKLPMMLTCAEFEAFVLDYLDGTLAKRQRLIFRMHLKVCRDCRSYLAAYERSVALGKAVFQDPESPVPGEVPEDLVKAIMAAKR